MYSTGNPHFGSDGTTINGGQVFISFGAPTRPAPRCVECGRTSGVELLNTDRGVECMTCVRPRMLLDCFSGIFLATPREMHAALYKRLAAVYHPDTGCTDPIFMETLNRVKDRLA